MRYRMKRLLGIVLVLVMGLCMMVHADEGKTPSVTTVIPISFSSKLSKDIDATVTIRDRDSGDVLKTITRAEFIKIGGSYSFPLIYTEPGNHAYSITAVSELGEECCYADVAVLTDDTEKLSATLVLYLKDSSTKIDRIEFGNWEETPKPTTPDTPGKPSTPGTPSSNVILGAQANDWYVPLLVMAAGIVIALAAVVYKRKTQKGDS